MPTRFSDSLRAVQGLHADIEISVDRLTGGLGMQLARNLLVPALLIGALSLAGCPKGGSSDDATQAAAGTTSASFATGGSPQAAASAAPTADSASLTATSGVARVGMLSGHGGGELLYAIQTNPQSGTVELTDSRTGAFTYTANAGFTGTDHFQFTVTNAGGISMPATQTIVVSPNRLGAPQVAANIGVNLDWFCYWCTAQPYVDLMRQAGGFGVAGPGNTPTLRGDQLDENGWPKTDFHVMVACCTKHDPDPKNPGYVNPLAGDYALSFKGKAKVSNLVGSPPDNVQYDAATNTTTATIDSPADRDARIYLTFTQTQRTPDSPVGSGVTDIRLIRPQYAPNGTKWWDTPDQEFTDPFIDSIKGFSTVRYMNWSQANNSAERDWADRTPPGWATASHAIKANPGTERYVYYQSTCSGDNCWKPTGDSWEDMIDIANATGTDMWINIPILATDDYVSHLAQLLKERLNPELHVYVEWSNEIWNWASPYWYQTTYADDKSKEMFADGTQAAANCASARMECYKADRLKRFSDIFAGVYGQNAINDTIRPVLCTQIGGPAAAALRYIAKTYGPPSRYFYGLCDAPYWGTKSGAITSATTPAQAVQAMNDALDSYPYDGAVIRGTATALFYGLHRLTYEGGPVNVNTAFTVDGAVTDQSSALADAVQREPGMKANVIQGLDYGFGHGIDMYMYYENQSATYWGAMVDPTNFNAPKFQGLKAAQGQMVDRTVGIALPGFIPVGASVLSLRDQTATGVDWRTGYCSDAQNGVAAACTIRSDTDGNAYPGEDAGWGYLVNVKDGGNYALSLVLATDASATPVTQIELRVDEKSVGTWSVPKLARTGATTSLAPLPVPMDSGLHVVEIVLPKGMPGLRITGVRADRQ